MLMPPWSDLPAPLLVVPANEDSRWLQFLASQPDATVFHHPAWTRALAETYGYRPVVLAQAAAQGAIVAGLTYHHDLQPELTGMFLAPAVSLAHSPHSPFPDHHVSIPPKLVP